MSVVQVTHPATHTSVPCWHSASFAGSWCPSLSVLLVSTGLTAPRTCQSLGNFCMLPSQKVCSLALTCSSPVTLFPSKPAGTYRLHSHQLTQKDPWWQSVHHWNRLCRMIVNLPSLEVIHIQWDQATADLIQSWLQSCFKPEAGLDDLQRSNQHFYDLVKCQSICS